MLRPSSKTTQPLFSAELCTAMPIATLLLCFKVQIINPFSNLPCVSDFCLWRGKGYDFSRSSVLFWVFSSVRHWSFFGRNLSISPSSHLSDLHAVKPKCISARFGLLTLTNLLNHYLLKSVWMSETEENESFSFILACLYYILNAPHPMNYKHYMQK